MYIKRKGFINYCDKMQTLQAYLTWFQPLQFPYPTRTNNWF